jgi:p-hydroxybenzoate 3-monooxygenase
MRLVNRNRKVEDRPVRTQVGIIGAGPAGLFLAHLLHRVGISAVNIECRSRYDVEETVRAGVLEHWVVELMQELGLGERMMREGHFHDGITLQWNRQRYHVAIEALTDGKRVVVYPQHEVLRDLIAGRLADGGEIIFGVGDTTIRHIDTDRRRSTSDATGKARWRQSGATTSLAPTASTGPDGRAFPEATVSNTRKCIRSVGSAS